MISVIPLDFLGQGALLEPVDHKLHDAAIDFCSRELADGKNVNFSKFSKVWIAANDGNILGIAGYVLRPDIPLLRAIDSEALRALAMRLNSFFADNGARGQQAFIYVGNEKPEQRCPKWRMVLAEFGAEHAHRFVVEVR